MFFTSWQLWVQLTFVLALAIVGVFIVGYGKLLMINRLIRRQEVADEEQRVRVEELRNNGQTIESRRRHDVPFGVRAIQSGIQVDGIWISQTNTPIPSELNFGHRRESSPDVLSLAGSHNSTHDATLRPPGERRQRGRPPLSRAISSTLFHDQIPGVQDVAGERPDSRSTYKPRRSSHLRFDSYGDYDEETLGQFEGKRSPKKKTKAHHPKGLRRADAEADSSAADNERSSGASSDSDESLSQIPKAKFDPSRRSLLLQQANQDSPMSISSVPSGRPVRASQVVRSSKAEYFSIAAEADIPAFVKSSPYVTPPATPQVTPTEGRLAQKARSSPSARRPSFIGGNSLHVAAPPVPGDFRVDDSIRKVNSGFEVLPAGTFGVPTQQKKSESNQEQHEDSRGKRHSTKLQKAPRNSIGDGRRSLALEKP